MKHSPILPDSSADKLGGWEATADVAACVFLTKDHVHVRCPSAKLWSVSPVDSQWGTPRTEEHLKEFHTSHWQQSFSCIYLAAHPITRSPLAQSCANNLHNICFTWGVGGRRYLGPGFYQPRGRCVPVSQWGQLSRTGYMLLPGRVGRLRLRNAYLPVRCCIVYYVCLCELCCHRTLSI